jgi:hypothetical protein
MAAHAEMSRRDGEEPEVCLRSIQIGGEFIVYYIVACQAFFNLGPNDKKRAAHGI